MVPVCKHPAGLHQGTTPSTGRVARFAPTTPRPHFLEAAFTGWTLTTQYPLPTQPIGPIRLYRLRRDTDSQRPAAEPPITEHGTATAEQQPTLPDFDNIGVVGDAVLFLRSAARSDRLGSEPDSTPGGRRVGG